MSADLARMADELEIRNLVASLIWHADHTTTEDLDAYVDCFTEDAEWEMFGDVRKGHADLREGAAERRRVGMIGPGSGVRHGLSSTVVEFVGPDEAAVRSYIQGYRNVPTLPELFVMGEYYDTYRRTSDGWRLAKRLVVFEGK